MKHVNAVSRPIPSPAFYYQLTLTQKIMELATLASFIDSVIGTVKGLFPAQEGS